jgi:hypothetical protein
MKTLRVYVLHIDADGDNLLDAFTSEDTAFDRLHDHVKDNWNEDDGEIPEDRDEAIDTFFDIQSEMMCDNHSYNLDYKDLQI